MRKILTYAFSMSLMPIAFTPLLLTGCADYDAVYEEAMRQKDVGTIVINLSIGADLEHTSRTPQGGEHGDGHELGQHNENAVHNMCIFRYNTADGIGSKDGSLPIFKLAYVDKVPPVAITSEATGHDAQCDPSCPYTEHYHTKIVLNQKQTNYYQYRTGDHFIVVTNMGDVTSDGTLGGLRDLTVTQPWTGIGTDFSNYDYFVMSNEHESYYEAGDGSENNPHKVTVTIERMAARIDFAYNEAATTPDQVSFFGKSGTHNVLKYTIDGGNDEVYLTHVRPFNVKQAAQGSYLIKRSACPKESNTYSYLIPETAYKDKAAGKAPNEFPLVVEPTTWLKGGGSADPDDDTRSAIVNAEYASNSDYAVHYPTGNDGFSDGLTGSTEKYYVLGYANENTMEAGLSLKEYATGYILRAVYNPEKVYKSTRDDGSLDDTEDLATDYELGKTFYRYRPLATTFDEADCRYFTAADDVAAETLVSKYGNHQLKATGIPYVIEKYTNGVCYYHVYARHDNSGGSPFATPMEFGIVRNNIYRLKVSFTGPGYPDPEVTNTEPLGIKPYLYTRPWYKVEHEEIEI